MERDRKRVQLPVSVLGLSAEVSFNVCQFIAGVADVGCNPNKVGIRHTISKIVEEIHKNVLVFLVLHPWLEVAPPPSNYCIENCHTVSVDHTGEVRVRQVKRLGCCHHFSLLTRGQSAYTEAESKKIR